MCKHFGKAVEVQLLNVDNCADEDAYDEADLIVDSDFHLRGINSTSYWDISGSFCKYGFDYARDVSAEPIYCQS